MFYFYLGVVVIRVLEGLGEAASYPAAHAVSQIDSNKQNKHKLILKNALVVFSLGSYLW